MNYAPGEFCWTELATGDWKASLRFYGALFGWTANEILPHVVLRKNGQSVAGLYENRDVHPGWLPYIAVASADDAARKAKSLGAKVDSGPLDFEDAGRIAYITDPQSARFAIWEAHRHNGAQIINEIDAMSWNELYTEDIAASREFYAAMFGWKYKISPEYTEIRGGAGGMFPISAEMRGTHPMWIPYFRVGDADVTASKAKSAGGAIYVGPQDVPNVGRFAIVADPQGGVFAAIRLQG
ncbi:MAG TPA: VOC family protein [Thermoanaerobaculia bacterium]|nr:VOC family protein [Thermoanaerobaculia bacterium]